MRDRNLAVGGPVVATTKKKKKRHLESGRYKRNPSWQWMRAGAQKENGNRRLDVEREETEEEEESKDGFGGGRRGCCSNPEDPSARSVYYQLDWTDSRVLVVRPGVVGATTGAGVGLPLLLLVVAFLGNQTTTTTAAPVVPNSYVSLDATPPRLLPRFTDSTFRRISQRLPSFEEENPSSRSRREELDYRERSSIIRNGFVKNETDLRLPSPKDLTTFNITGRTDPSSPGGGRKGTRPRGGRGGGGLARERTRRRQVAASPLEDRGSTSLDLVEPYWLKERLQVNEDDRFSRSRNVEPFSSLVEETAGTRRGVTALTKSGERFRDAISSRPENFARGLSSNETSLTRTTTTTAASWTSFRPNHRTVPRVLDDESAALEERNRKIEDDEGVGAANKNGGRFVLVRDGSGEVIVGGGGVVEWTTTTVAGPMSSWSYPEDEEPGAGSVRTRPSSKETASKDEEAEGTKQQVKVTVAQGKDSSTSPAPTTTTTQLPPPTQDTSMEALSASSYIVSVVLVLVVGALVGVLATVSHHLHHRRLLLHEPTSASILHHHRHHHRHHHHREELPPSHQRRLLLQDHHRHPGTPMLSVSSGMEVGSGLSGGLEDDPNGGGAGVGGGGGGGGGGRGRGNGRGRGGQGGTDGIQEAMVAVARDRAIRTGSVRQDLALDLPPRLQLPDGEERPYGAQTTLHLRDPEQESEIYQKCVRAPPNRTVFDSESPPPYRSQSTLLDVPERIVRCHSAGSSLLRVFRKFPSPGSSTPAVVVPPRRPTLSSYSESSSNLSNLSSLTVVPCETDVSQQQQQQQPNNHQRPQQQNNHQRQQLNQQNNNLQPNNHQQNNHQQNNNSHHV